MYKECHAAIRKDPSFKAPAKAPRRPSSAKKGKDGAWKNPGRNKITNAQRKAAVLAKIAAMQDDE